VTRYRVWICWRDVAEVAITIDARDEESALEMARRMGVGWGCGARRSYVGLVAVLAR
jgi:hypothetical protein